MLPRRAAVLGCALALLSCAPASADTDKYDVAINERCTDFEEEERPDRSNLEKAAGGDNWFVEDVLKKAENQDAIGTKMEDWLNGDGQAVMFRKGAGLSLFFILMLVFCCSCWSCCPCCRCCRACRAKDEQKPTSKILKLIGLVLVGGLGFGVVMSWGFAGAAFENISGGHARLGCTAAKLASSTVKGQEAPLFIGLSPMTVKFDELIQTLDAGSNFVTSFNGLVDQTDEVEIAQNFAVETLNLLQEMMTENTVLKDFRHKCTFCEGFAEKLDPVIEALGDSLGAVLNDAREQAKNALNAEMRADMRNLLQKSIDPINKMKDMIVNTFDPLVDAESWDATDQVVNAGLRLASYAYPAGAFAAVIFAFVAFLVFLFREKSGAGANSAVPHRCSCCSWWIGFYIAFQCFFMGGLLEALGVPLGVLCLTLDEFSGEMIDQISPALEIDFKDDEYAMLKGIVDQCLNPPDFNVPAYLTDILMVTAEDGVNKTTMRQLLDGQVKGAIDPPFAALAEAMQGAPALVDEQETIDIRNLLKEAGPNMDAYILPNEELYDDPSVDWAALPNDFALWAISVKCDDYTHEGTTIPGIQTFLDNAPGFQFRDPDGGCGGIGNVIGRPSCTGLPNENECKAINYILNQKYGVLYDTAVAGPASDLIFRCDVFESLTVPGQECLPWSTSTNDYKNCQRADGTYKRKEVLCNLADFKVYVESFDARIGAAFQRVDDSTVQVGQDINMGMRNLLDDEILGRITEILDGLQCNFLAQYYKYIVWGMCYEAVGGMAELGGIYVALGCLLVLLIMVSYALWRRSLDNYNLSLERPEEAVPSGAPSNAPSQITL